MNYAFSKVSNTVYNLYIPSFVWDTFLLTVTKLTPTTHTYSSDITLTVTAAADSTFETTVNAYSLASADTYRLAFGEDGVYKLNVVTIGTAINNDHIIVIKDSMLTYMKTYVNSALDANSELSCHCNEACETYYNFNILALLSASFFADDINPNFDYGTLTTSDLIKDYDYKCTHIGSGTIDFNVGSLPLLRKRDTFDIHNTDTALVLNTVYRCINTGTPDNWGSVSATNLTAYTDEFEDRLEYIADTIDRIDDYNSLTCTCNPC